MVMITPQEILISFGLSKVWTLEFFKDFKWFYYTSVTNTENHWDSKTIAEGTQRDTANNSDPALGISQYIYRTVMCGINWKLFSSL